MRLPAQDRTSLSKLLCKPGDSKDFTCVYIVCNSPRQPSKMEFARWGPSLQRRAKLSMSRRSDCIKSVQDGATLVVAGRKRRCLRCGGQGASCCSATICLPQGVWNLGQPGPASEQQHTAIPGLSRSRIGDPPPSTSAREGEEPHEILSLACEVTGI